MRTASASPGRPPVFATVTPPGHTPAMVSTTGELLHEWFSALDDRGLAEARACLLRGTYSRSLLLSLRAALAAGAGHRRGLDDPHVAQRGEPLGANLQTFLRDRFLTHHGPRLVRVPAQRSVLTG